MPHNVANTRIPASLAINGTCFIPLLFAPRLSLVYKEQRCNAPCSRASITNNQRFKMATSFSFTGATTEALTKHEILQDVLKETDFKPWGVLAVQYSADTPVAMGNTLSVEKTQLKPTVQFNLNPEQGAPRIHDGDLFTLVVTDPDAPSRTDKKWSEYCHYVEADIKILDRSATSAGKVQEPQFVSAELSNGTVLQPYVGPGPPKGTGKHRYVFLLYKQPDGVTSSKFSKVQDRPNWGFGTPATGVHRWASENKLEPISANFFFAETK